MTYIVLVMKGALPDCKQETFWSRGVTQQELALSAGLRSRSTFTRRLGLFANTAFWNALQRAQQGLRMRRRLAANGRVLRLRKAKEDGRGRPSLQPCTQKVLYAARQFAMPNRYNCRLPVKMGKLPNILDFLEDAEWSRLFDPRCAPEHGSREAPQSVLDQFPNRKGEYKGFNGKKDVFQWLWSHDAAAMPGWMDERQKKMAADLDDTARLVLTFYLVFGLLDHDGMLNVGQSKVGWCCGVDEKTVRRANATLAAAELIRVAHPKPEIRTEPDGTRRYKRGPQRILYLPVRRFTPEEAQAEADRFAARLRALEDSVDGARGRGFFRQALDIHAGLLRAWIGQERGLKAFHVEIYRRLRRLGMPAYHVRELLPRPPD